MSVEIENIQVGGVDDKRLKLTNSQWAGKLDITSNWTRLRVGARWALDAGLGVSLTGTPRLSLGVIASPNAGFSNGPLGATTNHFIGIRSAAATWTYSDAFDYYAWATANSYGKKINNTFTVATGGYSGSNYLGELPDVNRLCMMVEIEKLSAISTGITALFWTQSGFSGAGSDVAQSVLQNAMGRETMALAEAYFESVYVNTLTGSANQATIATDESADGYWDSICVAWDYNDPPLYVSDMMWAKLE